MLLEDKWIVRVKNRYGLDRSWRMSTFFWDQLTHAYYQPQTLIAADEYRYQLENSTLDMTLGAASGDDGRRGLITEFARRGEVDGADGHLLALLGAVAEGQCELEPRRNWQSGGGDADKEDQRDESYVDFDVMVLQKSTGAQEWRSVYRLVLCCDIFEN